MQEAILPIMSLAERDRRYANVRREMAARRLDCLILPQNTGEWDACQPDARYLTSVGGGGTAVAVVFPFDSDPIAIVREPRRAEFWKRSQNWVTDLRGTENGHWGRALVQAVRDVGCEHKRIGIVGLAGVLRFPDGIVTYGEFSILRAELTAATFENATDFMHDLRLVKSGEEIAMIERAQRCADAISNAIFEHARPGIPEHALYAEMMAAHIRAEGEVPAMLLIGIGQAPNQTVLLPSVRALQSNDILICESEIKYGGYMAQSIESVCLGTPGYDYQRLYDSSLECFHVLLDKARPGVPYAELIRLWTEHMEKAGLSAAPTMGHGQGLGQDGPTTRPGGDAQGRVIEVGHCFVLKPWATSKDGARAIRAGNSVVIEEFGARRLGQHEMSFRRLE
ncbi:M24 family metallopeptidase [Alphaproteobacteria bacterium]|nr:M24 family metallopeptidase [Alphaproteobacteria bacterium]